MLLVSVTLVATWSVSTLLSSACISLASATGVISSTLASTDFCSWAVLLVWLSVLLFEVACSAIEDFLSSALAFSAETDVCALLSVALICVSSTFASSIKAVSFTAVLACVMLFFALPVASLFILADGWMVLWSTTVFLSACCWTLFSWRSFTLSATLLSFTEFCFSVVWCAARTDLLSSKDKCTTSGDLSSVAVSLTCNTTSLGSWLRRALDWLLLALASLLLCWLFCWLLAAVNVSPRSSLPRELRWLCDLRLARACSSTALFSVLLFSESLVSLTLLSLALRSFALWRLSWRLLRLRSLGRLLSCWRLSWLSALFWLSALSSALVGLLSVVSLAALLPVSSDDSFLGRGLEGLALRGLRLLLSSASLLSSVLLLSVTLSVWRACWLLALLFDGWLLLFWLLFCWLLFCWGVDALWLSSFNTLLSTCPNEPRLCTPVLTSASIASAASRLLTPLVVCACGAWANKLDNQATACGWAAVTLAGWATTGAEVVATFGVLCACGACTGEILFVFAFAFALLRRSLLWLVVFCCCSGVLDCALVGAGAWLLVPLSATWRGWRVGCCSGRSFSAVCQSTS